LIICKDEEKKKIKSHDSDSATHESLNKHEVESFFFEILTNSMKDTFFFESENIMDISEYKEAQDIVNENNYDDKNNWRRASVYSNRKNTTKNFFKKKKSTKSILHLANKENEAESSFVENFEYKIDANDKNTINLIKQKDELINQLYKLKDEWEKVLENYRSVDEKRMSKLSETNVFLEKKRIAN